MSLLLADVVHERFAGKRVHEREQVYDGQHLLGHSPPTMAVVKPTICRREIVLVIASSKFDI
ncbi:MAG: hypothetical protein L0H94_03075 [Nitrospira sp.]|nr:hypothetical protein [Nitrospira sp.]